MNKLGSFVYKKHPELENRNQRLNISKLKYIKQNTILWLIKMAIVYQPRNNISMVWSLNEIYWFQSTGTGQCESHAKV